MHLLHGVAATILLAFSALAQGRGGGFASFTDVVYWDLTKKPCEPETGTVNSNTGART